MFPADALLARLKGRLRGDGARRHSALDVSLSALLGRLPTDP
jgi:hypothetical protein